MLAPPADRPHHQHVSGAVDYLRTLLFIALAGLALAAMSVGNWAAGIPLAVGALLAGGHIFREVL